MKRKRAPQMPGTRRKTAKPRPKKRTPTVPLPSAEARARMVVYANPKLKLFDGPACGQLRPEVLALAESTEMFGRPLEPEERDALGMLLFEAKFFEEAGSPPTIESSYVTHIEMELERLVRTIEPMAAVYRSVWNIEHGRLDQAIAIAKRIDQFVQSRRKRTKGRPVRGVDFVPITADRIVDLLGVRLDVADALLRAALQIQSEKTIPNRRAKRGKQ